MKNKIKKLINNFFAKFNLQLINRSSYKKLLVEQKNFLAHRLFEISDQKSLDFYKYIGQSKSQLKQDLFVLNELGFKRKGFFVEFGACDGITLSNTYLMETKLEWNGILCEPAKLWQSKLKVNRSASIDFDCVWTETGKNLLFNEIEGGDQHGELSTIDHFSDFNYMRNSRKKKFSKKYKVKSISLNDLLKKHKAPYEIDYLSIDTEGSEYEILKAFNFDKYNIKIITCEHAFTFNRDKIFSLLSSKGYKRKYTEISRFDDWYVRG